MTEIKNGLMNSHCGKIDLVIYSHGHTSHFENRLLVRQAPVAVVGPYIVQGSTYSGIDCILKS